MEFVGLRKHFAWPPALSFVEFQFQVFRSFQTELWWHHIWCILEGDYQCETQECRTSDGAMVCLQMTKFWTIFSMKNNAQGGSVFKISYFSLSSHRPQTYLIGFSPVLSLALSPTVSDESSDGAASKLCSSLPQKNIVAMKTEAFVVLAV